MRSPAKVSWPFTRYGSPSSIPFLAQCIDGSTIKFTIHAFSKTQFEDEVAAINAALSAALDSAVLDIGNGRKARIRWIASQILPDAAEADAYHGVNSFEAIAF